MRIVQVMEESLLWQVLALQLYGVRMGVIYFDSHSRDINGFPSPIGTSALLKFTSVSKNDVTNCQSLRKMISLSKAHYIKSLKEKSTLRKKRLQSLRRKSKRVLITSVLFGIGPCISGLFRYLRKIRTKLKLARYFITWFIVLTENSIFA